MIREDKDGFIAQEAPSVLMGFGINPEHWLEYVRHFGRRHAHCAASHDNILNYDAVFVRSTIFFIDEGFP